MNELQDLAAAASTDLSHAQLHGLVCGFLVGMRAGAVDATADFPYGACVEMAGIERLTDEAALAAFVDAASGNMASDELVFEPLLPDLDADAPEACALALVEWCTAFIGALSNDLKGEDCTEEINEILEDLVAITQLDHRALATADAADLDTDETERRNLFEVVEYVRVAVLLLWTSLLAGAEPLAEFDA